MNNMTMYLAGPMTGYPDYNRAEFNKAAEFWVKQGFSVYNPAVPDPNLDDSDWKGYMRRSIRQITGYSYLALLPGWEDSKGAVLEVEIAKALEMPIYYPEGWYDKL